MKNIKYLSLEGLSYFWTKVKAYITTELTKKADLDSPSFTGTPTAPTPTSGDDSTKIATTSFVKNAVDSIKTDLASVYIYKGSKPSYDQLPSSGNSVGDVWNVEAAYGTTPAGTNYAWTGSEWDPLGGSVDLSNYLTQTDLEDYVKEEVLEDYVKEEDLAGYFVAISNTEVDGLFS